MNVEELLRNSLHNEAGTAAPIDNLLDTSVTKGQRKQRLRRTAAVFGTVGAMGIVGAGAVVIANAGPNNSQVVKTMPGNDPTSSEPVTPWWDTWTTDRHDGPIDQTFLTNAQPQYDGESTPEAIKVWATGSEPDGTDWVLFTSKTTGHQLQALQGWNGIQDYGQGLDSKQDMTWTSFASPTLASHNDYKLDEQWLIVVGRPGTTGISYAADGTNFTPIDVHDGIGVVKLPNGIPATSQVQLSDANGVYATGTPYGAGLDATTSPTPGDGAGSATPSATPGDGYAKPDSVNPPSKAPGVVVHVSPPPTN